MRVWISALVIGATVAGAAHADVFSTRSRSKLFGSQTKVLDTRASQQYTASVRLQPPKVNTPTKWDVNPAYSGKYKGIYLAAARDAARRHGVPEDLFLRLIQQESGWNPSAKSHKSRK